MKLFAGESIAYGLGCQESLLLPEKCKQRRKFIILRKVSNNWVQSYNLRIISNSTSWLKPQIKISSLQLSILAPDVQS